MGYKGTSKTVWSHRHTAACLFGWCRTGWFRRVGPVFVGLFGVRCGRGRVELAALDALQHRLTGAREDVASTHREYPADASLDEPSARSSSVTRIRQGAPGVSCSPAMNPSASQRWSVEGATSRMSAARAIGNSSSSGGSPGGWRRGIFREPRRPETISAVNRSPRAERRPWRLRIPAIVASS